MPAALNLEPARRATPAAAAQAAAASQPARPAAAAAAASPAEEAKPKDKSEDPTEGQLADFWEAKPKDKSEDSTKAKQEDKSSPKTRSQTTSISGEYFKKHFTKEQTTQATDVDFEKIARDEENRQDRESYEIYSDKQQEKEKAKKKAAEQAAELERRKSEMQKLTEKCEHKYELWTPNESETEPAGPVSEAAAESTDECFPFRSGRDWQ